MHRRRTSSPSSTSTPARPSLLTPTPPPLGEPAARPSSPPVGARPSVAPPAFAPCISTRTPARRTQARAVPHRSNRPDLSAPPRCVNHDVAPGPGVAPRRVPRAAAADHPRPAPGNATLHSLHHTVTFHAAPHHGRHAIWFRRTPLSLYATAPRPAALASQARACWLPALWPGA
jgi:hypothetical protein